MVNYYKHIINNLRLTLWTDNSIAAMQIIYNNQRTWQRNEDQYDNAKTWSLWTNKTREGTQRRNITNLIQEEMVIPCIV